MTRFNNKKVYIAPKSPLSMAFKQYLSEYGTCHILGFIDKNKDDSDVCKIETVQQDSIDHIIILSPNH